MENEFRIAPEDLPSVELGTAPTEPHQFIRVFVNDKEVVVPEGSSILDACNAAGTHVPTLCYHPRLRPVGLCGMCAVSVSGQKAPVLACSAKAADGLCVTTDTPQLKAAQASAFAAIIRKQKKRQASPGILGSEFGQLAEWVQEHVAKDGTESIVRDPSQCVECTRCVRMCKDIQGMNIISMSTVEDDPFPLKTPGNLPLFETDCIGCGQCSLVCPAGAVSEVDDIPNVLADMEKGKVSVCQIAPAVRVGVCEEMGLPPGSIGTYKLIAALRQCGFQYVFDTQLAADLTIVEEGSELLKRVGDGGPFPMFTSCCPGWINLVEKVYPQFRKNLSTCKSPQGMMGALLRTFWANKKNLAPKDFLSVSCMPCTAKKQECKRPQLGREGYQDVDYVLTTRELGNLFRQKNIVWKDLKDSYFDHPLGKSAGAADLFAVSGGVMEAALRSAYELATNTPLPKLELAVCRGIEGVKEATVKVGDLDLKVCIVNGIGNARNLLDRMVSGEAPTYHFIEIMCCPGGCIGGGGQPRSTDPNVLQKRMEAHYRLDEGKILRKSHENPDIKELYEQFLEKPLGHKSHELLHTVYTDRSRHVEAAVKEEAAIVTENSFLILYGSQTGTAEAAARTLLQNARAAKLDARMVCMEDYDPELLVKETNVAFVISTFGEGEMPDNSKKLWAWCSQNGHSKTLLQGVQYAVFGLGSTNYAKFCKAAIDFDVRLENLGATRITPVGKGDQLHNDKYEGAFVPWMDNLWSEMGVAVAVSDLRPNYRVVMCLEAPRPAPPPPGAVFAKLTRSEELTPEGFDRPTRLVEFDLGGRNFEFTTGDSLSIYAENSKRHVLKFLKNYGLNPQAAISVVPVEGATALPVPPALNLEELFCSYLDVFDKPKRSFFKKLSAFATDPKEMELLALMGSNDGAKALERYLKDDPSMADVLTDFSSARPSLDYLLDLVPIIQPRPYSIASSHRTSPNKIELVIVIPTNVSRARGKIAGGGLCTRFISRAKVGSVIGVARYPGTLMPPEDPMTPLLLVGLGVGLAPMRGILYDRLLEKKAGKEVGPAVFYYACRHKEKDFLLQDEWALLKKEGVLTEVIPSFSHDDPKRFETADMKINENPKPVWDILGKGGHYFYCGPAAFNIPQILESALTNAVVKAGGKTEAEAVSLIEDLKLKGGFCQEAF